MLLRRAGSEAKGAEVLLKACLDNQQKQDYAKDKAFKVQSKDGAIFELASKWAGNAVEMTPDGKRIARFCIHQADVVPIPDLLLAQKLMLESDPAAFRKIANRTQLQAANN